MSFQKQSFFLIKDLEKNMLSGILLLAWHLNMIQIMLYVIHCSQSQKNGLVANIVKWEMENLKVNVRKNLYFLNMKLIILLIFLNSFSNQFSFKLRMILMENQINITSMLNPVALYGLKILF